MTKWICPYCKGVVDDEKLEVPIHLSRDCPKYPDENKRWLNQI